MSRYNIHARLFIGRLFYPIYPSIVVAAYSAMRIFLCERAQFDVKAGDQFCFLVTITKHILILLFDVHWTISHIL